MVTFAPYLLMSDGRKNNSKYSSAWFLCGLLTLITNYLTANDASSKKFYNHLTQIADTTVPVNRSADSLQLLNDTLPNPNDSLVHTTDTFSVQLSKDTLDQPIDYSASDSIVFVIPEKKIILFAQGKVTKGDMDLAADSIMIDQQAQTVTATYRSDTAGRRVGKPKMVQGGTTTEADVIRYNTKTQRGLTQNAISKQGEIFIQGEKVKKVSVNDFFAYRSQFTTCNLDTPHFAFRANKMKLINQKLAISGPIHPEFEGVPIPIYLPFGIFPISQGRHSGFLPPQFTASEQFGLGLQNMGYYKVFNDNIDARIRGDIYTYGGWAFYLEPEYRVRYRYNGRLAFTMMRTRIISEDPKQDFTDTRTFNINWSHQVDSKARPGTSFQASVNAGSTKFNQLVQNNPLRNYNNMMNSSISYSKTWDNYNLTVSANHNQNSNSGLISLNLPTVGFTMNTLYPLQKKEFAGTPKWYEKLGIGLNSNFANEVSFYDSLFSFKQIVDTMQWGAQHNIPIQLSLPSLGPLQISPGISLSERWFSRKFERVWNDAKNKIDTSVTKGFFAEHDVTFSLSLSTALFGKLDKFSKNSKIAAIRHVIRPTVSLNYKPDLTSRDYYDVRIDRDDSTRKQRFSYFDGAIFSPFGEGNFGGISFGLDNNLEMKVRQKQDTGVALKKIKLIDGFGINGSYNLMADSFKLSPLSLYIRSTLFDKISITASGTLDPYKVNKFGDRTKEYVWKGGKFTPGRLTNGSLSISTSFKSKPKDEKKQEEQDALEQDMAPLTQEEQMLQLEYAQQNPAEFADFNIPWNVSISYSLNFYRRFNTDYKYTTEINSTASVNGDFNLTPRWKLGMNTYYDVKASKIQMLTMYISREMHCWQLSINVTPVGLYRSFNITVSPKSGILRDLRINRTRSFYSGGI
jgi:lipopolysaccharide export system protein LptA